MIERERKRSNQNKKYTKKSGKPNKQWIQSSKYRSIYLRYADVVAEGKR